MNQATTYLKALIDKKGLVDAGFNGPRFTWSNKRKGDELILARLDRILYNVKWLEWKVNFVVDHLNMIDSDHKPLMINIVRESRRKKMRSSNSFVFEHFWLEYPELKQVVEGEWNKNVASMAEKLERLKGTMMRWNWEFVGNLERKLENANRRLKYLPLKEEECGASDEVLAEMRMISNLVIAISRQIKVKWWSKSRMRWIEGGDRNTKYFHSSVLMRRKRNNIDGIMVDDQ
ncbi:hypothetical protein Cni_G28892 [Canna indica]|uniref:Reverse transcriptase n=1 Tax=Canna indica TaxID=4628 RepID=A0AAQ3L4T6_9LILI|nr:hypothetical protein Cni_G28892 [Canna indica]